MLKKKRRGLTKKEIRNYSIIITTSVIVSFFSYILLNFMFGNLPGTKVDESSQVSSLIAIFSIIGIVILLMLMVSYYFLFILILNQYWSYKRRRTQKKKR